jgi:MFS superfamily sulfate permease-like transporter
MMQLRERSNLRALFDRSGFLIAAIVIAAELTLGVLYGIALGVVLALIMLIYRTSRPQIAVLGQLPGTEAYRDVKRHPEAITFPELLIWRPGSDLFFASIGHAIAGLKASLNASSPPAKHVLFDAGSVNLIDTSSCDDLLNYIRELQGQGITFAFARVRDQVRERMRLGGIEALVGTANFHERVTDGVRAWQRQESPVADSTTKS